MGYYEIWLSLTGIPRSVILSPCPVMCALQITLNVQHSHLLNSSTLNFSRTVFEVWSSDNHICTSNPSQELFQCTDFNQI